jgi:hypothetical protein
MRHETIRGGGELIITGPAIVRVLAGGCRVQIEEAEYDPVANAPPVIAVYKPGAAERRKAQQIKENRRRAQLRKRRKH